MSAEHHGATAPESPVWERLHDQLRWYEDKCTHNRRWFQTLKVMQLVIAAAIPVIAAVGASAAIGGALGAIIVVLEGMQQLFQFQQNWITYRTTAEALKHEQFLYLAEAGPYTAAPRPLALLAERVEGLMAREHASWAQAQQVEPAGAGS
jgi:hypothetical protein